MNISQVIKKPVLTEKSVRGEAQQKYTLVVDNNATKVDVKIALLELYGVKVEKVNITKTLPKSKMGRRAPVEKRQAARKAVITLKKGEKLDISQLKKQ